jgi:hypothetical protein
MQYKTIEFTGVKLGTECIEQTGGGTTDVHVKKEECEITWRTVNRDVIFLFRLKEKRGTYPFKEKNLPTDFVSELTLTVKKHLSRKEWVYYIEWKDPDHNFHISDPKISINPRTSGILQILLAFISAFIGLFTFKILSKKFIKK